MILLCLAFKVKNMNHYNFNEIEIGAVATFEIKITEKKMKMFTEISGDLNPLHINPEYAKERGYVDKVVYGMLASSYYSTLIGVYLPGEKCLLNKCDVDYRKPVYIGDILTVFGEVVDKRNATHRLKINGKMVNQEGETVNTAKLTVSFTGD